MPQGLARALLAGFRVLILNEPTEHLEDAVSAPLARDLLVAAGDRSVLVIAPLAAAAAPTSSGDRFGG